MDKHSINGQTALNIVGKIFSRSMFGLLGTYEVGNDVAVGHLELDDSYLDIRVRFCPGLTIEVFGEDNGSPDVLEHMFAEADKVTTHLHSTFEVFQVA
jgi:hypothetical protein